MPSKMRVYMVGALALAGAAIVSVDAQAMPVQDLNPTASSETPSLDKVWWRGGYGGRRGWGGYGWRGGYGYRGYGWGWRRPFYGYGFGWRRPYYGWRRW